MSRTPVVRTFGAIKSRSEIFRPGFFMSLPRSRRVWPPPDIRPLPAAGGFPGAAYSTRMNRRPSVWQQGQ